MLVFGNTGGIVTYYDYCGPLDMVELDHRLSRAWFHVSAIALMDSGLRVYFLNDEKRDPSKYLPCRANEFEPNRRAKTARTEE